MSLSFLPPPRSSHILCVMLRSLLSASLIGLLVVVGCSSQDSAELDDQAPSDELATGRALSHVRRDLERESGGLVRVDPATGARTALTAKAKTASLSFDCMYPRLGGSEGSLEVLDVLAQKNVKTTIFVAGGCIFSGAPASAYRAGEGGVDARLAVATDPRWASFVRRMVDDGHEFGNHSVRHIINAQATGAQDWEREMRVLQAGWNATMRVLYGSDWAFVRPNAVMKNYWRAPGGDYGSAQSFPNTLRDAARGGFPIHMLWHLDTLDSVSGAPAGVSAAAWAADGNVATPLRPDWRLDAGLMSDAVLRQADSGKALIVLAHLSNPYHWGAPAYWSARGGPAAGRSLGDVIDGLRARNYVVGKLSQVIGDEPAEEPTPSVSPVRGITCNAALGCVWSSDCGSAAGYSKRYTNAEGTSFVCKKPGSGGCDPALECPLP